MSRLDKLIVEHRFEEVMRELEPLKPVDIAEILTDLEPGHALLVFRLLDKLVAAEAFSFLDADVKEDLVNHITDTEIQSILEALQVDDAVNFIEEMPANIVNRVLAISSPDKRNIINQFLQYKPDSAGSVMTVEFVALRRDLTVAEALEAFKKDKHRNYPGHVFFVTNDSWRLEGLVTLKQMVLSDPDVKLEEIMDTNFIYTYTYVDQEEVASLFRKYDLNHMPVLDKENRLVGVITVDDVMDVMVEEQTEDLQKMAAMDPSDKEYLKESVFHLAKHRVLWLLILMISATFTGRIINHYEEVLASMVMLAMFIPMLMDTGGNAGSQSSTLIIRGLALGQIKTRDIFKVIWKEFRVGVLVGIVLVGVNALRIMVFEPQVDHTTILVVSVSMFVTIVLAKVTGSILPILAKLVKLDPAIMAGPLITTIVDACALLVYFGMASLIIGL